MSINFPSHLGKGVGKMPGSPLGPFAINIQAVIDKTQCDDEIRKMQSSVDATGNAINQNKLKLTQLWSYGNQIVTLILNNVRRAAKGTKLEAEVQEALGYVQLAQGEWAVIMAAKQLANAYATGNIPQAIILSMIVASMQTSVVLAQINREAARTAREEAERLHEYVEMYRN